MYITIILFFLILIFIYKYNNKNNIEKFDINNFYGGNEDYDYVIEIIELDVNTDKDIIKLHMENDTLLNKADSIPKLIVIDVRNKTEISKGRLCYSLHSYSLLDKLPKPIEGKKNLKRYDIQEIWTGATTGLFPIKNKNKTKIGFFNFGGNKNNDKKKKNLYFDPNLQMTYIALLYSVLSKTNILLFSEDGDKALQIAKKLQTIAGKIKKNNKSTNNKNKIYVIVNGGYNELTYILSPELICHPKCVPIKEFGERETSFSLGNIFGKKKKKEKEKVFIDLFGGKNKHVIEKLDIQKQPDKIVKLIKNSYKSFADFIKPIDIRNKEEINNGFLCDSALLYSFSDILIKNKDFKNLLKNNNRLMINILQFANYKKILIYCSDGNRALKVAEHLASFKSISQEKIYVIVNGGYQELKHILPSEYVCDPRCEKKQLFSSFKKSLNF